MKISQFDEIIQPHISHIKTNSSKIGLSCTSCSLEFTAPSSSFPQELKPPAPGYNQFKVTLPYAGELVTWEVLFDPEPPYLPPDFIFHDDFFPDVENLPTLISWKIDKPGSTFQLLQEVMRAFRLHHLKKLQSSPRLYAEYKGLLEKCNIPPDHIEILEHYDQRAHRSVISLLIQLPLNLSEEILSPEFRNRPCDNLVFLLLQYQKADSTILKHKLYMSAGIERLLSGQRDKSQFAVSIPKLMANQFLIDYVPRVTAEVQQKLNAISSSTDLRRCFVSSWLQHDIGCVIEFDTAHFLSLSVLLEWHDFFFCVIVELSNEFPLKPPNLCLRSVYHESNNDRSHRPYLTRIDGEQLFQLGYNSAEVKEMPFFIRNVLLDRIKVFQRDSVTLGKSL